MPTTSASWYVCYAFALSWYLCTHYTAANSPKRGCRVVVGIYNKKNQGQINLHFSESGRGKSLQNATQKSNLTLLSIAWIFFLLGGILGFILRLGNPGLLIGPPVTSRLDHYWACNSELTSARMIIRSRLLLSTLEYLDSKKNILGEYHGKFICPWWTTKV